MKSEKLKNLANQEGSCGVTMDAAKSVTANFNSLPKPGIPTNMVITAGKANALFSFSPPAALAAHRLPVIRPVAPPAGNPPARPSASPHRSP